jgi:hypothetical protein
MPRCVPGSMKIFPLKKGAARSDSGREAPRGCFSASGTSVARTRLARPRVTGTLCHSEKAQREPESRARSGLAQTSPLLDLPPRFVGIVLGHLADNLGGFLS